MFAQVHLRLSGPLDQLRLVWQTGETVLENVAFEEDPEGTRYNVLLALQEMVTNVLRHSYELDHSRPIELSFSVDEDGFEVVLTDQGPEFDPLQYDSTEVEFGEDMPTEIGGFGIYIARIVMDEVHYERSGGVNRLRMRKSVRATSGVSSGHP